MADARKIPAPRMIRFSPFELDVRSGELRKHGIRVRLHDQPFRILLLLLDRPGEVVLREELRRMLWPNNTVVEFDHSINAAIQRLRDALGDSADNPRYVETLARRGYRFIGTLDPAEMEARPPLLTPPAEAGNVEPLDPANLCGLTFSHFRVTGRLGSGGMGVVYRADDLKLGRQVALKFLPILASEASPQVLERFQREARAASALNHPNICTIYGVEEFAGQPVIVMELLEGETLAARLARGPMPPEKALPLAIQIANAMAEAHHQRIVHRDLKPANVMLTKTGAKVLDFGLAKLERAVAVGDDTSTQTTQVGAILGSLHYMSPEQVQGKEADARSDIFSFGCVLLEMLSSEQAFTGDTSADVMSAILTSDPFERVASAATIAPALHRILRHCLEKDPEERFQSSRDLAFGLEALSRGSKAPVVTKAMPPRTLSWRMIAAAASLILLASAGSWWAGRASRSSQAGKFQRLTFRRGFIQGARFTPDGQSVIYAAGWDGQPPELFSTQPGSFEARALGFPSTCLFAMASTGAMSVATNCSFLHIKSEGTLAVMALGGGAPREILEHVASADWARDGQRLAISILTDRGRPGRLEFPMGTVLLEMSGTGWAGDVKISPNGDLVAFTDHFYNGDDGSVAIVDLQGRKRTLTGNFTTLQGLAWSPNGREIWFTGAKDGSSERQLYAVAVAGGLRVVSQVPGSLKLLDMAADGRVLLAREEMRSSVQFVTAGQSSPRDLTWLGLASGPQLSADGKTLMTIENGDGTGGKIVTFVRGTDGSPAVRLGDWMGLSLSPDRKWVATVPDLTDPRAPLIKREITLVPVKAGKPLPIQNGSLTLYGVVPTIMWTPDSRRILYSAMEAGHEVRTFAQDIAGGRPSPVTPEGFRGEVLSPDGATLVVRDSQKNAFLYPIDGGTPKRLPSLTPEHVALSFSTDSRMLYIAKRNERPPKVWRVDLGTGQIEIWREVPYDPAGFVAFQSPQITPDGQALAYTVKRLLSALYLVEGLK
jgi:serine/threonine protein kinase/DNA-binding winged helix-turn-helix (wHTH) protein/Tol biopolymer transport system component